MNLCSKPIRQHICGQRNRHHVSRSIATTSMSHWLTLFVASPQGVCKAERQVVGWFDIEDPERFQPEIFPVFIVHDANGHYYGLC